MMKAHSIMTALTTVGAFFMLAGCGISQWSNDARAVISERGSAAADATAENLEFGLCRALPVGTVFRRYADSEETWRAYRTFCTREFGRAAADAITPVMVEVDPLAESLQ